MTKAMEWRFMLCNHTAVFDRPAEESSVLREPASEARQYPAKMLP
jgi:hypothetical protein